MSEINELGEDCGKQATIDTLEIHMCSKCGRILEYTYNSKGRLSLACNNNKCKLFMNYLAIDKDELLELTRIGFALGRVEYE